jgi:hypothetical protein
MKEPQKRVYIVEQDFRDNLFIKKGDLLIPGYRELGRVYWWHLPTDKYGNSALPDPHARLNFPDNEILLNCRELE